MKLRNYAIATTGALAFVAAAVAQWIWTQRPIQDVVFISMALAFIAVYILAMVTDEEEQPKRRKHRARTVSKYSGPVIVTLDREEWEGCRSI